MPTSDTPELPLEDVGSDGSATGLEVERHELDDSSIKAPFDPAKIDVITQARTVDLLLTRLKEGEMNLSPDFQRRGNLWSDKRKSGLIESMLLRIPIPSLYVAEDTDGNYTVVDGLQRMCAIAHFAKVEALNRAVETKLNPLRLAGLQSLPTEYNGKSFAELPRPLQRRISETELTLHVIRASTPQAVKFNIFSRINQGGLPLTSQEIRNAIYPGEWRSRIRNLSSSTEFITATENKIKGERQEDLELVLRFIAHYAAAGEERPENQNLDDFLNNFVQHKSPTWTSKDWDRAEEKFRVSMVYARKIFGIYAFRKYYGRQYARSPINRGLFESVSVVLSGFSLNELEHLSESSDRVLDSLEYLFRNDKPFTDSLLYATGRGGSSNVRISRLTEILQEVLDD